jgi:GNAT superfamily N-acetyltransferase
MALHSGEEESQTGLRRRGESPANRHREAIAAAPILDPLRITGWGYRAFRHRVWDMESRETIQIRLLEQNDPLSIAAAFKNIGWNKPETQYRRYLHEQVAGTRTCFVAVVDGQFAGYVTVNWRPDYVGFADLSIPEIQDLNVLTTYRRKGIATRLLDRAEGEAGRRSGVVGIAVGLHPGYNAAQRLYAKRGYIPDGRGITYRNRFVEEGTSVVVDDDLVMHFTKQILERGHL